MRRKATNLCKISMIMFSLFAVPVIFHLPLTNAQNGSDLNPRQNRSVDFTDETFFPLVLSGYSFGSKRSISQISLNKDIDSDFQPSMKILSRIMKVMLEKNSIGKTNLSLEANVQYGRLLKHLEWLEEKNLVESVIEDGKANVRLTSTGKEFATMISLL